MDAKEFVKRFGWDYTIKFLNHDPAIGSDKCDLDFGEHEKLVELVDAYELVQRFKNRHGGIRHRIRWGQYRYGDTPEFNNQLKQAIQLVGSVDEND